VKRSPLVWVTSVLCIVVVWIAVRTFNSTVKDVRARWDGETLTFSSVTGRVVISHLEGRSNNMPVAAPLPVPLYIVDSEGVKVDRATYEKLHWRNEGGNLRPAPPVGSEITGLYQRLQPTTWRPASQ
jgi:hypothetical protein